MTCAVVEVIKLHVGSGPSLVKDSGSKDWLRERSERFLLYNL